MRLTKKEFSDFMNHLEENSRQNEEAVNALCKVFDSNFINTPSDRNESLIVSILQTIMQDDDDWISYYIYDLDFGKDYKDGMITNQDGSDCPLRNAEDLYDILVGE